MECAGSHPPHQKARGGLNKRVRGLFWSTGQAQNALGQRIVSALRVTLCVKTMAMCTVVYRNGRAVVYRYRNGRAVVYRNGRAGVVSARQHRVLKQGVGILSPGFRGEKMSIKYITTVPLTAWMSPFHVCMNKGAPGR